MKDLTAIQFIELIEAQQQVIDTQAEIIKSLIIENEQLNLTVNQTP